MAAKILIIEDESVIRRELKILLENAMYEVAVLTEFHHILPQIAEQSPDLILLDINLPGCSGFDLCTQIRGEMVVPVIFPFEPPAGGGAAPASPAGAAGPPALAMLQAMVLGVVVPSFHW